MVHCGNVSILFHAEFIDYDEKQMSEPESEKLPINLIRPKAESSSPQPVAAPQKVVETKKSVNEESKAPESAPRLLPAASPSISTYNGGKTNKYAWSQSINEVTVEIQLDQKTTSKFVRVHLR